MIGGWTEQTFDIPYNHAKTFERYQSFGIRSEEIWSPKRFRKIAEARSVLCYWAVKEMGVSMTMLSREMGISVAAISGSVIRGQKIVEEKGLKII